MDEHEALRQAVKVGAASPCAKSRRGVVLFHRREGVVAVGFNHPPHPFACDGSDACRASCNLLCVHAETAALHDLRRSLAPIRGRDLEMLHVKVVDGEAVSSGPPSCPQCSREILEAGLAKMWLLREDGLQAYDPVEFHELTLRHCEMPVIRGVQET